MARTLGILQRAANTAAESRVERAIIVDVLDELWKVLGDILEAAEGHCVDCFDLYRFHEAFGLGVVIRISPPAHRAGDTVIA